MFPWRKVLTVINVVLKHVFQFLCFIYLDITKPAITKMVLAHKAKWIYAVAGSGVVLGLYNYLQSEKKCVQASWTTNFTPSVKWDNNWDKRDISSLVKPAKKGELASENSIAEETVRLKPTSVRHLLLIRHGQYDISGLRDIDRSLTMLGRLQAEFAGQRLKDLKFNYTRLIHSTMTRAIETAEIIQRYLPEVPVEKCELLREGAPIPPEPPIGSWKTESKFFEEGARIEAAFRKYFHRADASQKTNSYEILVCHANVIRYFVCRVLQFPPEAWLRFSLHHCSLTWVAIHPNGRVTVYAVGDCGHIPPDKMSTS